MINWLDINQFTPADQYLVLIKDASNRVSHLISIESIETEENVFFISSENHYGRTFFEGKIEEMSEITHWFPVALLIDPKIKIMVRESGNSKPFNINFSFGKDPEFKPDIKSFPLMENYE